MKFPYGMIIGGTLGIFLIEAVASQHWGHAFTAAYWFAGGIACCYIGQKRAQTVSGEPK